MVRKTVVLHPIIDYYVRQTQGLLTQILAAEGLDIEVTYSVALNYMLLWIILAVVYDGKTHDPRVLRLLQSFLHDKKTIEQLNLAEIQSKFSEKIKEIRIIIKEKVSNEKE